MKKKTSVFLLALIQLFCIITAVPVLGEETVNTNIYGVWTEDGKATVTVTQIDCKRSNNPRGVAVFYDSNQALQRVLVQETEVTDGNAQWCFEADEAMLATDTVSLMLWDWNTISPLCEKYSVSTSKLKSEIYNPVPEIEDTGTYGIRASFETGTIECFKYDTYTTQCAEYYITNDVPANTGRNSCYVSNRTMQDVTVMIRLDDAVMDSKVKMSCYVRADEGISEQPFYFKLRLSSTNGISYIKAPGSAVVSYGDWVLMSSEVDFSQYDLIEAPWIFVQTDKSNAVSGGNTTSSYYIDDLLITSDCDGMFYDDMNYTPTEKGEDISDTAENYTPQNIPIEQNIDSLKDVFKDYFKMGIAVADRSMNADSRYGQLISKHFNSMTSEGRMKEANILTSDLEYNFKNADEVMEFAKAAGVEDVVGHTLIWEASGAKPFTDKFSSRDETLAFMKEYITKMIKHFEGDGDASEYKTGVDYSDWHVDVWDVVNEAAAPGYQDGYVDRNSGWYDKIGSDYATYAFRYANDLGYDDIELRYNDFGEFDVRKADNIYGVARDIIDAGVGLDSLGIQSHYTLDVSLDNIKSAFEKFASLGIEINISELDVSAYTQEQLNAKKALYESGVPKVVEYKQSEILYELFKMYKEYSDIIDRVTLWSASDRLSFRNNGNFSHKDYAGIFDRNLQAKPQYWAITDFEEYKNRYSDYDDSIDELVWDFEDEYNYGISRKAELGKWTGINSEYIQESTNPSIMSVYDVSDYNQYQASIGETQGVAIPTGRNNPPPYGSKQCMTVYNGTVTTAQAMGTRVKLSREELEPGKTFKMSFYMMSNSVSYNTIYAFLRKYDATENISERIQPAYDAVPWLSEYTPLGNSTRYWSKYTVEITPTEADFDDDGYANLWILSRSLVRDGTYYKSWKGEYLYIDDIEIHEKVSTSWSFENNESDYTDRDFVSGKWTGINSEYIQESTRPTTMSVYDVTDYNVYQKSIGETSGVAKPQNTIFGYPITPTPPSGSKKCMTVYNGSVTTAQALGARVKLSSADVEPGKTYKLSFYQMSNSVSHNSIYAFFRKYDETENISEKSQPSYDAVPWLSDYTLLGKSTRYWNQYTVELTPAEADFDDNGYTTLWILSRSLIQNGTYHKSWKGEYLYLDEITLVEQ